MHGVQSRPVRSIERPTASMVRLLLALTLAAFLTAAAGAQAATATSVVLFSYLGDYIGQVRIASTLRPPAA